MTSDQALQTCIQCEKVRMLTIPLTKRKTPQCTICGCFMDMKTKFIHVGVHCPINKW